MDSGFDGMYEEGVREQGSGPGAGEAPRPHAQCHLLSPTDKCKVCAEPAAKHVHYGAMTCFSCRAFFRRSIQNKTAATYVCRRSRNCEIKLNTRKNCQYCRYQKCLGAGMKPSWVLSEDERQRRFRRNRERGHEQETPAAAVAGPSGQTSRNNRRQDNRPSQPRPIQPQGRPFPQATLEEARLMTSIIEQQQQQLVIKKEQQVAAGPVEIVVKSESGDPGAAVVTPSYILAAPVSSMSVGHQQPTILLYSASSSGSGAAVPAVIVSSGAASGQVRLPCAPLSQPAQAPAAVTITPATDVKPTTKAMLASAPGPSVIVQTPPKVYASASQAMSGAGASEPFNLTTEKKYGGGSVGSSAVSSIADAIMTNTATSAPRSQQQKQTAAIAVAHMGTSKVEIIQEIDWDSNYEEDVFSSDEEGQDMRKVVLEPEVKFCQDEWYQINQIVESHNDRYRSVNFGEELIKEMIMCSVFSIPVSTSAAISGYRLTVERITRIAHNLDCFTELSKGDQSQLLMENADLLVNLRGAIFFDSRKKGVNQILISMGIEDMDMIKSIFTPLLKENSMKHIDYKTFNSIQTVENNGVETRYGELQSRVASLLSSDDIITVLTTYIILFSVDFCSLAEKRRVEQTQEFFIRMLQRYIYSQSPRKIARIRLANTLEMITCLREMADIKKMRKINVNVKVP